MKTVQGLALRLFRANRFIISSSIFSIALAVMLILSMILFSFNAQDSLKEELRKTYGDMDLSVGFNIDQDKEISNPLINQIINNRDVEELSKVSITHVNVDQINDPIYTVGIENDHLPKSRYHFKKSLDDHSLIMNKGLATALHVQVGDKVHLQGRSFTLVETIHDLSAAGVAPDMLIMNQRVAKSYVKENDGSNAEATYILISAKQDANLLSLSSQIKGYDKDLRIDIAEQDPTVQRNLQSLHTFVIILSLLVLIITALLIISNFELLLYKMKHQFAIMRSLGATTKQTRKVVFIQSTIINGLGVCLGFSLTFLSQTFIYRWMEKLFHFSSSSMYFNPTIAIIVSICSFIIIQLFLLIPAYRSTKILPLKTMEENEKLEFGHKKGRVVLFKLLIGISAFLIIASQVLPTRGQYGPGLLLGAAISILLSFFLILSVWLPRWLTWLLPYGQKIVGQEYYVAIKNIIPQVRKNSLIISTISALMIIAVFGSSLLKSVEANEQTYLKNEFLTPIVVDTRLNGNTKLDSQELMEAAEQLPSVQHARSISTLGIVEIPIKDGWASFDYALVDFKRLHDQKLMPHVKGTDLDTTIVISKDFAKKNHLKVGQTIQLGLYSNEKQEVEPKGMYKVGAISDYMLETADVYFDSSNKDFTDVQFYRLFVSANQVDHAVKELEGLKNQFPELKISSYDQSVKESSEMIYQRYGIFIAVIAILVLSTMIGVFNSLANNIYSKRKEYAILRTMGVKPKGIRKIVLTQVTTYMIIGLCMGIIMGITLTYILALVDLKGVTAIDYDVILSIIGIMLLFSTLLFSYIGNKMASKSISLEIMNDNK
ncbi:FtsX-like permease family protein [Priestia endophytica]|uniref:FtsX-like permease family protein n=1 Tax=Priestia endophytica TaxID=135735 RepID=UPI00203D07C7|nr:FtsX-like permease family protein [Priestia endophytica]MCM3538148.1 FtsX-like permease family protein [Priestia endophytica]